MSEDPTEIVQQSYEVVAWRGLALALLAQILVPAPENEEECSQFLHTVLADILDQTVNSEAMPAELDRSTLRAELEGVNKRLREELAEAQLDRQKLRKEWLKSGGN
ncbi:hypothetical protein [Bosea sp. AS-1]|uniref:hypothetical protein n=1 Tax=Bosea sp. AS-1 TaxID=2015316 RepID=UPI000B779757|nr:hypothetical protein [Bosea sp. AS-1]